MATKKTIRAFLNFYYMHSERVLKGEFTGSYFTSKIMEYDKTITHIHLAENIVHDLIDFGLLHVTKNKNKQGEYLLTMNKGVMKVIDFIQKGDA